MRTSILSLLSGFICLFLFTFPAYGDIDMCLTRANDSTLVLNYIPNVALTAPFGQFWSSQVVTLRYPDAATISVSNFTTINDLGFSQDGATPGSGYTGAGDGFNYIAFSNDGSLRNLPVGTFAPGTILYNAGDTIPLFSFQIEVSSCGAGVAGAPPFELITGGDLPPFLNGSMSINTNAVINNFQFGASNAFTSFPCPDPTISSNRSVNICMEANGNTLDFKYVFGKDYNSGNDANWASQVLTVRYPDTSNINFSNFTNLTAFGFSEDTGTPGPGVNGGDGFFYKVFSNDGSLKVLSANQGDTLTVFSIDVGILSGSSVPFQLITGNAWTTANNGDVTAFNIGGGGNVFCEFFLCGDTVVTRRSMEICLEAEGNQITVKYIPGEDHLVPLANTWTSQVVTFRYPSTNIVSFSNFSNLTSLGFSEDTGTPGAGVSGGDGFNYKIFSNDGSARTLNMSLGDTVDVFTIDVTVVSSGEVPFELITEVPFTNLNNANATVLNVGGSGNIFLNYLVCTNNIFPVELVNFTATKRDNGVVLDWATESELNSDFFQIERSYDATLFENLDRVNAAGTTTETQTYQYIDNTYTSNRIFYRLKMVDLDGSFEYSNIVEVRFEEDGIIKFQMFPNPASNLVSVVIPETKGVPYGIHVRDVMGRLIMNDQVNAANGTALLDVSNVAEGIYIVELVDASNRILDQKKLFVE